MKMLQFFVAFFFSFFFFLKEHCKGSKDILFHSFQFAQITEHQSFLISQAAMEAFFMECFIDHTTTAQACIIPQSSLCMEGPKSSLLTTPSRVSSKPL